MTSNTALVVAAVAQIVAAGGTSYLALKTRALTKKTMDLAMKTEEVAKQTARAADAGAREAKATEALAAEARRDRELTWQPLLTVDMPTEGWSSQSSPYIERLIVMNVGRGPAVECIYASRHDAEWCLLTVEGIREGGDSGTRVAGNQTRMIPWELFEPPEHATDRTSRLMRVLMCSDQFGNRYRFGGFPAEVSRVSDEKRPGWATWRP